MHVYLGDENRVNHQEGGIALISHQILASDI